MLRCSFGGGAVGSREVEASRSNHAGDRGCQNPRWKARLSQLKGAGSWHGAKVTGDRPSSEEAVAAKNRVIRMTYRGANRGRHRKPTESDDATRDQGSLSRGHCGGAQRPNTPCAVDNRNHPRASGTSVEGGPGNWVRPRVFLCSVSPARLNRRQEPCEAQRMRRTAA